MFCKNCGAEISEEEKICGKCGYQIGDIKTKKERKGIITRLKNIIFYNKYRLELLDLKDKGKITEKEFKKKLSKVFIDSIVFTMAIIIIPPLIIWGGYTIKENINETIRKSKEVPVPNLIGKTLSEAKTELSNIELNIEAEYPSLYSDSPEAIIQSQKNKEGDILMKGDTVRVTAKTQVQLDKEKQDAEERKRKQEEAKAKGYRSSPATTDTIISCAKTLIDNSLRSSSTAKWGNCEKIDEDNYGRCLVYVSLEAQNGFGAYSKLNYFVILQYVKYNGEFTYKPYSCMHELTVYGAQSVYDYYVKTYKNGEIYPVIQTFLDNNEWNVRPSDV